MLGVVIGDEQLISSTRTDLEQSERRRLARENAELTDELRTRRAFQEQSYPALVAGELAGERIGLVFLGPGSDEVVDHVRDALEGTGGRLGYVGVLRQAPPPGLPAGRAAGTRLGALEGR